MALIACVEDTSQVGFPDGTVYAWEKKGQTLEVADEHVAELLALPGFSEVDGPPAKKTAGKTPVDESAE